MDNFLRRVLPSAGPYTLMTIDTRLPDGDQRRVKHVNGIQSLEALEKIIQRLSMEPLDVYYATGSFAGRNRADPLMKRALFLDLDAKDFGDKQNAIKALQRFIKVSGFFPASLLVDSGRGIHVYWALSSDVPAAAWRSAAILLKASAHACEFPADPAPTADAMRVLRVPGTLNFKGKEPVPCKVLKDWGYTYDFDDIVGRLAPKQSDAAKILAGTVGDDLSRPAGEYAAIPYFTAEIVTKCGVFKEALETGGRDHIEPLWSNILSVSAFTDDAEHFVEPLSSGHKGYDKSKAEAKLAYKQAKRLDGSLRPVLCTTFAQYRAPICDACPFNGKIKTPLVLGKREEMAYLPPWIKITDKGVFKKVQKAADDGGPEEWKLIFPYHIGNVELVDQGIGELHMRATFTSKSNVFRLQIPTTLLAKDGSALCEYLVGERIMVGSHAASELKGFMMSWLKTMQDIKRNSINRLTGMGWGEREGQTVFVAGQKIFTPSGGEDHFSHTETSLLNDYSPRGNRNIWDSCAKILVSDGRQAAVATLMTSFAAPLMAMTGTGGLTFSIYSAASGTGKSSLLKTAQAVWGHPIRGVNALDDTMLSLTKKLGFLNSLPAFWDELRGDRRTIHSFAKIIFQLSQGKEKSRLSSAVKMQEMGTWKTLITMASNERINDHMDQISGNTNAGRMRVFEVTMPPIKTAGIMDSNFSRDIAELDKNFGHTGQTYAKYLSMNRAAIATMITQVQDQVVADLTATAEERFWVGFVAAELTAAHVVNAAGILTIDVDALKKWLYAEFRAQRAGSKAMFLPPEITSQRLLFQYIDNHRDGMLVVERMPKRGSNGDYGAIMIQPRDKEIIVLKAHADKKIRIKLNAFRNWIYDEQGYAPTPIIQELQKTGAVKTVSATISAGLANMSNAIVECLEVDLEHPAFVLAVEISPDQSPV